MRLLDLFCGAGGAAEGYRRAGFTTIVGVDTAPQPHYGYGVRQFVKSDALWWARFHAKDFDAIHASPPCQCYTNAQRIQGRTHPDYIADLRRLLQASGKPWVIENVVGAPLEHPVCLCGTMFGLPLYRHRLFEASFPLVAPPVHPPHTQRQTKMGRPPQPGEIMQVVGNFSGVAAARQAMGIDWMTRDELREAIPPAYTEHIGRQLLAHLQQQAVA